MSATLLCSALWSCGDDDTNNFSLPSSHITLDKTSGSSAEGSGEQRLAVRLDKPQEGKTIVNFQVEGSATVGISSYSKTDVRLLTESPLVIEAGETEAFITFELVEDEDFEPVTEQFTITLNSVLEGNAQLSTQKTAYTHVLQENDYELTLSWEAKTTDSEKVASDQVDLDLSVEQSNSVYIVSDSKEGVEKLLLTNVSRQSDYRINVWYYQGSADISYTLTYRAADAEEQVLANGTFANGQASDEFDLSPGSAIQNFRLVAAECGLKIR